MDDPADENCPRCERTTYDTPEQVTRLRKFKFSTRRARVGSMPSRFLQTDDELQNQRRALNIHVQSKSVSGSGILPWNRKQADTDIDFDSPDILAGNIGCHQCKFCSRWQQSPTWKAYNSPIDSSDERISKQHKAIYRELLHSLLHPLGAPDVTPGFRPKDLLSHVREVFQVDEDHHERCIREDLPYKHQNLQVNATILEANGLKNQNLLGDACDTYCLLSLIHVPAKGRVPHRGHRSPATTPRNSLDYELLQTSTSSEYDHPCWNEEFVLDITDYMCNELHIFVCSQSDGADNDETKQLEKSHGLKSFLGHILSHTSQEKENTFGSFGKIVIPVREISALGTDDWFDIIAINSPQSKPQAVGKCHISLGISYKQDDEGTYFSNEDYYKLFLQFINHTYRNPSHPVEQLKGNKNMLCVMDEKILQMVAEAHRIPKISQAVAVICILELITDLPGLPVLDSDLTASLDDLRLTWATKQTGQTPLDRMPLTDTEISHYRRAAGKYIHQKCNELEDLPDLFPPYIEGLNLLKSKLGVTVQLLSLDLWEPSCAQLKEISWKILHTLQEDVARWMDEKIDFVVEENEECFLQDKVILEIPRLHEIVDLVSLHCNVLGVVKNFYGCFNINFYNIISSILEKKVSEVTEQVLESMNVYLRLYNNSPINMKEASKLTLRLYFVIRSLYTTIRDNFSRREVLRLRMSNYQKWFESAMTAWLHTFKSECISRMEKALEIDKDVVLVTNLAKYSNSSVDILSCFATVMDEWRAIDFRDPDCALMGVMNITDTLCDGARLYADKIHSILEKNCYYDSHQNPEFDVKDTLCITINNIEHVRNYLEEIPKGLLWDNIVMMVSCMYKSEDVGVTVYNTLQRLVATANEDILMKSCQLLRQIAMKMWCDMERYLNIFIKLEPENASSVDQFLGYISTNLRTLQDQLLPAIYPYMIQELWRIILLLFDRQVAVGKPLEHYGYLKKHLKTLCSQIQRHGLGEQTLYTEQYNSLKQKLELNSKPSVELMLLYFRSIALHPQTPTEYIGHMLLQVAYREETHNSGTIFVHIIRANDLPGLDHSGYSDPYVDVSLRPQALFGPFTTQRTNIINQTLNPVFNASFQFPNVPRELMKTSGSCILFAVMDHDRIGSDDFAGEIAICLSTVPKMDSGSSIDRLPTVCMPLYRPKRPMDGPFAILNERRGDKLAKKFVANRLQYIEHQRQRTDKCSASHRSQNVFNF